MHRDKIVRAYERFLELPVTVVLAVLWLTGVGFLGLFAIVLYLSWVLLREMAEMGILGPVLLCPR